MQGLNLNRFNRFFSNTENSDDSQSSSPSEQQNRPDLSRAPGDTPAIYATDRNRRGSHPAIARHLSGESADRTENPLSRQTIIQSNEIPGERNLPGAPQKENYESLLKSARTHVETLKKLKGQHEPPRNFILETRDDFKSELLIEEIIASENEREPNLNLGLCRNAGEFAHNIDGLAESGVLGQKARYITTVRLPRFWHVVAYEATVVAPGKIYMRGFDSLPASSAQKYFDAIGNAIKAKAACEGKKYQIKLDTFATGQQHSPAGCDIFSLSFALKSLDEQFDANLVDFEEGKPFDSQLIADEKAEHLPITYYKHAQPPEIIDQIKNNPRHKQDINKPVNKNEKSLAQRYDDNKTTQQIYSLTTRRNQSKTFSDSIDAKRIVFYERLIKRLEEKLQACQEAN